MGDGEQQEGQIWEAAMEAAHYKLDNLIGILDNNGLQIDGKTSDVMGIEPHRREVQGVWLGRCPHRRPRHGAGR